MTYFDESLVGIKRCQSPLEIELVHAFARTMRFEWRKPEAHHWEVGHWPGWFLALLAQPEFGEYRADFGISTWVHEKPDEMPFCVIIEVDGHDYHERTKEQARRDKARDRFMTRMDARVLRFTGSEVYRDADACAYEVLNYITRIQGRHLSEEFKRFVREHAAELPRKGQ